MTEQAHHTTRAHKQPEENGLAIASFVLGIFSVTGFGLLTGIPAIITGSMSLKNPHNKGLGIAGLIMGIVATVGTILLILFFIALIALMAMSDAPYYEQVPATDIDSSHTRSI